MRTSSIEYVKKTRKVPATYRNWRKALYFAAAEAYHSSAAWDGRTDYWAYFALRHQGRLDRVEGAGMALGCGEEIMRVIIAGSRTISDYALVERAIHESGFEITKVISGHARGVDRLGELWARKHKVPVQKFIPDWDRYGKSAGHIRNAEMANVSEGLILIWDGQSHGSASMLRIAKEKGLKIYTLEVH